VKRILANRLGGQAVIYGAIPAFGDGKGQKMRVKFLNPEPMPVKKPESSTF
jgi:hypothetical protein